MPESFQPIVSSNRFQRLASAAVTVWLLVLVLYKHTYPYEPDELNHLV